ncbi:S8 family peptidase [Bradyrhizobium liaoningense]|uniref:S8 family peptidase n=1 Tax=Bradyrhizobium liaoningense TaxID=43992 RepID=UPI001BAACF33|nr:S8 family peptidase [Bradyrhizobium liaoningense]MBR0820112.1 S8 family peptidase [Bradyrhizobium liaoningense]
MFEVTGSVQNFAKAVQRIDGLEFAGEEELEADDFDQSPEFYLLVPQLGALQQIVSLWELWVREGSVPRNYTPWRDLFSQLRAVRPWGPTDRVSRANREYFHILADGAPDTEFFGLEIELVFRSSIEASQSTERDARHLIETIGGQVVHQSRRPEFAYHALLAEVPTAEIRRIAALDPTSLAGADPIAAITPQSIGTAIDVADEMISEGIVRTAPLREQPIAAVFDAIPVQAHPLLIDRLRVDDPDDLETRAVGQRVHGTAMASLVVHGDLNDAPSPLSRQIYFRPVMYAPAFGVERFDENRLVIDVIFEAVMRMRSTDGAEVIIVNLSLGDTTKPFSGKISTWARALDYLSYTYGILFIISAGNSGQSVILNDFPDEASFSTAPLDARVQPTLAGIDSVKADRRVLAPADSINSLTIGAWHHDFSQEIFRGTTPFPPFVGVEMPNFSSRLGPGLRRAIKPEALFAGGRERVRIEPASSPTSLAPHPHPSHYWGLKAASPSQNGTLGTHFTIGTSAAAALATHSGHRIFDALEQAYPQLIETMPLAERASLLKAFLVHSASWRGSEVFVRAIVDPTSTLHHEHWRREVSRYLGFGFVDPDNVIACANDRATLWATGTLGPEDSLIFDLQVPRSLTMSASMREIRATLAWFTPTRPGHLAYRAVKLKIDSLERGSLQLTGVSTTSDQPSNSQSESGTVVHRRWTSSQIGEAASGATIPIQIQRERDQGTPIDEPIPFGLVITIEMPGEAKIYEEVLTNIQVRPRVPIHAQA